MHGIMFRVSDRLYFKLFQIHEVIMFHIKSKKIALPLFLGILLALLTPVLVQAELGGSGDTAARDRAAQREAQERKLEKKRQKAEEAKKEVEGKQKEPAETVAPTEGQPEKPAGQ
jgi:hypothetical protein